MKKSWNEVRKKYKLISDFKEYKKNISYPFWEYDTSIVAFTNKYPKKLTISEMDRHPSAEGQQLISKYMAAALDVSSASYM